MVAAMTRCTIIQKRSAVTVNWSTEPTHIVVAAERQFTATILRFAVMAKFSIVQQAITPSVAVGKVHTITQNRLAVMAMLLIDLTVTAIISTAVERSHIPIVPVYAVAIRFSRVLNTHLVVSRSQKTVAWQG